MQSYWVKTPDWLPHLFPRSLIWKMPPEKHPAVYLTFDDGPHSEATVFALDCLKQAAAKATFFCIGKNIHAHPELYNRILAEGHVTGNHTYHHLNGWKTVNHIYYKNILEAGKLIENRIFRPPYGRIKISQSRKLTQARHPWQIYMWDVLSGDFDTKISPQDCLENVIRHIEPGSIVVFHDSEKAFPRMRFALPEVLSYCRRQGWQIKPLPFI